MKGCQYQKNVGPQAMFKVKDAKRFNHFSLIKQWGQDKTTEGYFNLSDFTSPRRHLQTEFLSHLGDQVHALQIENQTCKKHFILYLFKTISYYQKALAGKHLLLHGN